MTKNKILENTVRQALQQSPSVTNETHLHNTLILVRQEACRRQMRKRISFPQFLARQIKFMGYKIWIVQGIFLFFINRLLSRFYGYTLRPQSMVKLLFCLSVLICMSILPSLYRSVRYQMQEIEAAARFSCAKLLLAKLIIVGIGDISLLGGIFFTTMLRTSLPADRTVLYLCLPFLLAGSGCLFLLGHCSPRHFIIGSLLFCMLLILGFCVIPVHCVFWFQQSFSLVWILVCVLLAAFCERQLCHIIRDASYTEIQLA